METGAEAVEGERDEERRGKKEEERDRELASAKECTSGYLMQIFFKERR